MFKIIRKILFKTGLISFVKKILYKENSIFLGFMSSNIKMNSLLYKFKTKVELANYSDNINIHDNPPIHDYWFKKYITPKLNQYNYASINDFYTKNIIKVYKNRKCNIRILSIGSGNCDLEFLLADALIDHKILDFHFECIDINQKMLNRAMTQIKNKRYSRNFSFVNSDFNNLKTLSFKYDVIIANMCLHHVLDLKDLFIQIELKLRAVTGRFLTYDMIGRNGHMRWPEALLEVDKIWLNLPSSKKFNHYLNSFQSRYLNYDASRSGFEGIRSQDILKLLNDKFYFESFFGFANIIEVFVDRAYGPNYDPKNNNDRKIIDEIHKRDEFLIRNKILKPTHMLASMSKSQVNLKQSFYNISPGDSIRNYIF